jgi:hypothetical protein
MYVFLKAHVAAYGGVVEFIEEFYFVWVGCVKPDFVFVKD